MTINFKLPKNIDGRRQDVPLCARSLVIIGANGSGKSRFSAALAHELGGRAIKVSALNALYLHGGENGESEFERLMALMLHDEIKSLLAYKLSRASGEAADLKRTRLDKLIEMWQEVYPGNKMLIEADRLMFARNGTDDRYNASRLSDGERAVLYLIGAMLYAPSRSVILVDSPEMFLHPTIMMSLWNRLELMRPDCTMVYTTHDLEFASSRQGAATVWVKNYAPEQAAWEYSVLPPGSPLGDEMYMAIMGARKPVLFIEGDSVHSIDARLYPLIFKDYTVRSLGSCDKVIESTRTFNDLKSFHHMVSMGIVDRDRRDVNEVEYLRRKNILVPDVAEIENILLIEEVVRAAAEARGRNENKIAEQVKSRIIKMFAAEYREQALMHTRHRVKRTVEYRVDGRFTTIDELEKHISGLVDEIAPRKHYDELVRLFKSYIDNRDYNGVLRVFNRKSMLPGSNISGLLGLNGKGSYVEYILRLLREDGRAAARIRAAVKECFGLKS